MILVLTSEGACPPGAPDNFAAGHDLHAAPGRGPVALSRGADIVSHRGSIPAGGEGIPYRRWLGLFYATPNGGSELTTPGRIGWDSDVLKSSQTQPRSCSSAAGAFH